MVVINWHKASPRAKDNRQDCGIDITNKATNRKNLSIEVVLLDSKCFPLLDNESTQGTGFWKSTLKVLAASRCSNIKLTGKSSPEKATIYLTEGDSDSSSGSSVSPLRPPLPKRPRDVESCQCSSS